MGEHAGVRLDSDGDNEATTRRNEQMSGNVSMPVAAFTRDAVMRKLELDGPAPDPVWALEENLAAFLLQHRASPGVRAREDDTLTWVLTGIAEPFYNAVVRTRLTQDTADAVITEVLARFRRHNVPALWWVQPSSEPADLGARLEAQGMTYRGAGPGMAADLATLPADTTTLPGFTVERVCDVVSLMEWVRTHEAAYGETGERVDLTYVQLESALGFDEDCPYQRFLGRLNGLPVATSAVFLGAGVAGLYGVSSLPDVRGRGIGSALSLAALREAKAAGCRMAVLESSPLGYSVYQHLGFREVCRLRSYILPAS